MAYFVHQRPKKLNKRKKRSGLMSGKPGGYHQQTLISKIYCAKIKKCNQLRLSAPHINLFLSVLQKLY
jgi:hypothetical protein